MSDAAAQAAVPAPIALLGTLLTIGGDANSALSVARALKRNLPLVVLSFDRCVVLAKKAARFPEEDDDVASRPNGAQQFGQRDGALAHPAAAADPDVLAICGAMGGSDRILDCLARLLAVRFGQQVALLRPG